VITKRTLYGYAEALASGRQKSADENATGNTGP
jgi:hypothetical protein